MNWYLYVLTKKYAVFSGRARRKEYWFFVLFNLLISWGIYLLGLSAGGIFGGFFIILSYIYDFAMIIPSLAVIVRRLHDTGRSGWWYFIILIPFIGGIVLLVFLVADSQPDTNKYGPSPKDMDELNIASNTSD